MTAHPLDRAIWSSLNSGWAQFARKHDPAIQIAPEYGPFAAAPDRSDASLAGLARCTPSEHGVWVVEADEHPTPPGLKLTLTAPLVQMTAHDAAEVPSGVEIVALTEADAADMLALARLTKPGPFTVATHRLAPFIGVKRDGRLAAMAGERMRMPGHSELSGVCTHPDFQGHGYGALLSTLVTRRILNRGETPFLHAYAGNETAIRLYERLGYRIARRPVLSAFERAKPLPA